MLEFINIHIDIFIEILDRVLRSTKTELFTRYIKLHKHELHLPSAVKDPSKGEQKCCYCVVQQQTGSDLFCILVSVFRGAFEG